MALRGESVGSLTLEPATTLRPWLLARQGVTIASIDLPPEASLTELFRRLQAHLAAHGLEIACCGACQFWQEPTEGADAPGHCLWARAERPLTPGSAQTALASPCAHFAAPGQPAPAPPPLELPPTPAPAAKPWPLLPLLRRRQPVAGPLTGELIERSGRRPGAIPCLVCPGRMANLGAHKCRTTEGDERTFSIWRCRACLSFFLNDYTDRWVRTDALEVLDIYYRLAPQETLVCLAQIETAPAGQADLQDWFDEFLRQRTPARREVRRAR